MPRLGLNLTLALAILGFSASAARAEDALIVKMFKATSNGPGDAVGTISITRSPGGVQFKLDLRGLPPGGHGFHVHQNDSCLPTVINGVRIPAGAAGGHWDPDMAMKHTGPTGNGHKGDLPLLEVANNGTAVQTLTAPRIINIYDLRGRSLVINVGGDTYTDQPRDGGGGLRLACGEIAR